MLDRDRGRETFDEIDVRFFHLIEKLPGISRKALDIAPLPLGVEGVESEGRLPRTAHSRDDDQLFPRNLDMEILKIVLARPTDLDSFGRHRT